MLGIGEGETQNRVGGDRLEINNRRMKEKSGRQRTGGPSERDMVEGLAQAAVPPGTLDVCLADLVRALDGAELPACRVTDTVAAVADLGERTVWPRVWVALLTPE